jgi:hypothetical protein
MSDKATKYETIHALARETGLGYRALVSAAEAGQLPTILLRGRLYARRSDFDAFLAAQALEHDTVRATFIDAPGRLKIY